MLTHATVHSPTVVHNLKNVNRGIYIQILENNEFQDTWDENKSFWNESSDIYTFLRNHTRKIELKFDVNFNPFSNNEIPLDGIKMLIEGIKNDLSFLISEYDRKPQINGVNYVDVEYKGKLMKLYYKSSKLHLMIWRLVKFLKKLESVINNNKKVFVCGNAYFNENMLESLMKLKLDFKNKRKIDTSRISKKELSELVENEILIKSDSEYKITRKGLLINIVE